MEGQIPISALTPIALANKSIHSRAVGYLPLQQNKKIEKIARAVVTQQPLAIANRQAVNAGIADRNIEGILHVLRRYISAQLP